MPCAAAMPMCKFNRLPTIGLRITGPVFAASLSTLLAAAVVLVAGGEARLIRRRETVEDILRFESA